MTGTLPLADMLASRRVALGLLTEVLQRRQALDHVLEQDEHYKNLDSRDRAFVRMMTATTLRRLGQVDDLIRRASERQDAPQPPALRDLLRLGVTQVVFMDTPDYAVVDTSVRLAAEKGLERQKGFVNALLRRVAREGREWLSRHDESRMNIPEWLLRSWIADYGLRPAGEIAIASLAEAPLDITIKDRAEAQHWAQELSATPLPTGSLRRQGGGAVQELPGFDEGRWWVQDAAAALPATLFGDVAGQTVIDLCAAPGGKTAQLAAAGAHVIALDRSVARLKRLSENMQRLRLEKNVTVEAADAGAWKAREKANFILLDAPCSATGTLRRHPDALHLKSAQDVERLAAAQARLLDHALTLLAPGGILVYCTCSLQKAEGEGQIDALLARNPSVRRLPVAAEEIGGLSGLLTPEGDVRVLPFHLATLGGMDGFFVSRLTLIPG